MSICMRFPLARSSCPCMIFVRVFEDLTISAGFIPTIAMDALAAYMQCRTGQCSCTRTSSSDNIFGTDSSNTISGGGGGDNILGRGGNDVVSGGSGGDNIIGSSSDDRLNGDEGSDALAGGSGRDTLNGGDGDDVLNSGGGDDTPTGGPGADEFDCGDGTDTVTDFNEDEGDTAEDNFENGV
ncbi:MAG: hypothetical protein M3251_04310 [Thermoproteota archaeon]|nr:hypothetical protein [Thermoproteota archaeon]